MHLEMYFPAPLLMQYTDAVSTGELRFLSEHEPEKVYLDFVKNSDNDVHTTILLLPNLKKRFLEYRNALRGLILGRDIKLFFSRDCPEIPEWDPSDLEFFISDRDLDELRALKLRKYRVIERIIITDMLFRLYYDIYPEIKHSLRVFREADNLVKNFTMRKSAQYATILKDFIIFDRHHGARVMNVFYPEQLTGFKATCFPLMSWSGLIQLGMLHFFASGRWEEVNDVVGELKKYKKGDAEIKPNLITEPSSEFLEDCKAHYKYSVEKYSNLLKRFANEVKAIADEGDPLEKFILDSLPATFFDIYENAKSLGYDIDAVMFKLRDLIRRGVIKSDGEVLKK